MGTVRQQSHHCGIETELLGRNLGSEHEQQSHHCGIETLVDFSYWSIKPRSNRTIVGLKQHLAVAGVALSFLQQSHHCGIETNNLSPTPNQRKLAAIAPLWD